jgi:hypothetical protein
MEVKISQIVGVRLEIQARSHTITCDQPADNGGEDSGMTPPELLLASLGSCAAFYAAQYLRTRNLTQSGVEVTVTAGKLLQPARLGNFRANRRDDALRASLLGPQHVDVAAGDQNRDRFRRFSVTSIALFSASWRTDCLLPSPVMPRGNELVLF